MLDTIPARPVQDGHVAAWVRDRLREYETLKQALGAKGGTVLKM